MESQNKLIFLVFVTLLLSIVKLERVNGAGECGRNLPDNEAWKLASCASAAQDARAKVSDRCCAQVKRIGKNPGCLCAVMLSNTAKSVGARPEIALTIPKRCNLVDRPIGYKCGSKFSLHQKYDYSPCHGYGQG